MNRLLSFLILLMLPAAALAFRDNGNLHIERRSYSGAKAGIYRLLLTDKQGTAYSLKHPARFLSRKSIERRRRQGLQVDSTDLPVSRQYLRQICRKGVTLVGTSKWNNSVLIQCGDSTLLTTISRLPFVKDCCQVWQAPDSVEQYRRHTRLQNRFMAWDSVPSSRYAAAERQMEVLAGKELHDMGYVGQGMTIAVLDGGFENADCIPAFAKTRLAGSHDFVYPPSRNIFSETDHGTKVYSVMASNAPHVFVGTAPGATYWLLRCEDQQSEQPVEEDYWAMAAEFADSVGADLINSSLGYTEFDRHLGDHQYHQMDGHSTFISHTASMLARKGIILVNSAGNNGMGPWKKLSFPADAEDILTVGAVTSTLDNAPFSSVGPTQDGRVKPDLMAIGSPTHLLSGRGTLIEDMGTSFATPIICGLMACLWQALPSFTAVELMDLIRQTGSNRQHPDNIFGYGLPDFKKAYRIGRERESGTKGTR